MYQIVPEGAVIAGPLDFDIAGIPGIEVHGYFTTNPDMVAEMLDFCDSPYLGMNMDTGNTYISGQDPVAFCGRFQDKVTHVHVKDVSESLAAMVRGGQTGIALSHCSCGKGVNADNITRCLQLLKETNWSGAVSIECNGADQNIRDSVQFLRDVLAGSTKPA